MAISASNPGLPSIQGTGAPTSTKSVSLPVDCAQLIKDFGALHGTRPRLEDTKDLPALQICLEKEASKKAVDRKAMLYCAGTSY